MPLARNHRREVVLCRDLLFRWRPDSPVILDLPRLVIESGERVFVAGPSGSGKSTLLGLLAGVTVAGQGTVTILGQPLERLRGAGRDRWRADHLGYIFQLFNLLPYLSVLENVILPCRFSRRRRERAIGRGGSLPGEARRLLAHLEMDDPALLSRPVVDLSVGQQQRVAAARALIGGPELILADEPTSALDMDRREAFVRLLFEECAAQKASLVLVSHDTSLEPLFDRSLRLTAPGRE
jgi:putative ABC transport system ATP-binding protein